MNSNQNLKFANSCKLTIIFILINYFNQLDKANASEHSAQLSTKIGQLVTSSTLVWESYNLNPKQLESAVQGGKYITADEHYPIFVCRINLEGVYIGGCTEKQMQKHLCIASNYKEVRSYERFDVLVNKGHLGKVSWKPWVKFSPGTPIGSISVGEDLFIARRKRIGFIENIGADYQVGRLDTTIGLGKILVVDNNKELEFEEGEILIETEPFRYELRDIQMNKEKSDLQINVSDIGSVVLANRGNEPSVVETVMSYPYDVSYYWGVYDGVAKGLPTKIFESGLTSSVEINWGIKYTEKHYATKQVSTHLIPGTAINVTLRGNYTNFEAPYTAKLVAFYQGSKENFSRKISSIVKKVFMGDLKFEFSPVYWIENGTFVPTTTTTTTSTTEPSTMANLIPTPIQPPAVFIKDIGKISQNVMAISNSDSKTSSNYSLDDSDLRINQINDNADKIAENLKQQTKNASSQFKLILKQKKQMYLLLIVCILFYFK